MRSHAHLSNDVRFNADTDAGPYVYVFYILHARVGCVLYLSRYNSPSPK